MRLYRMNWYFAKIANTTSYTAFSEKNKDGARGFVMNLTNRLRERLSQMIFAVGEKVSEWRISSKD